MLRVQKLILILGLLLLPSCGASSDFKRYNLSNWSMRSFPKAGVNLELPTSSFEWRGDHEIGFTYELHHKSNGIADATWGIVFRCKITNAAKFEDTKSLNKDYPYQEQFKISSTLRTEKHPNFNRYYQSYLKNNKVYVFECTYRNKYFNKQENNADIKAIKRIFKSISFISS